MTDVAIVEESVEHVVIIESARGPAGVKGPQGPQGGIGPQGPQGGIGPQGVQGNFGTQGPQGIQGDVGTQGTQGGVGPQGTQGSVGAPGPQGWQGDTGTASVVPGPQGNQGVQGPQGASVTGPQGAQGAAGLGAQGPQGDAGVQGVTGGASVVPGPQGDIGYQGPQGVGGAQGPQGITGVGVQGDVGTQGGHGVQGSQGDPGPQGPIGIGSQGPQGDIGTQGPQGFQGVQGDVGPQGFFGTQGAQGDVGAQGGSVTGPQGVQGVQGPQGPAGGPQGDVGNQGPQGPQGPAGGPQGPQGIKGDAGLIGPQGAQGAQGDSITGASGFQGPQGAQGAQGASVVGTPGTQGGAGGPGPQGFQGPQGTQGVTGAGTQGPQGGTGVQGPQGAFGGPQGSQGAQGIPGPPGPSGGPQGFQGTQGPQGFQGPQGGGGVQGAQGIPGPQGAIGFGSQGPQGGQGTQGNQGFQGTQGPVGPQGFIGLQGPQGSQGLQGIAGAAGLTGIQGPQGFQGMTGASANVFFYQADANGTSLADPGTGKMRWDNANQQAATNLVFDRLTFDGFDALAYFRATEINDEIIIQEKDFSYNYQTWKKTAAATEGPDFFWVPAQFVTSAGTGTFTHNTRLAVLIKSAGVVGQTGPQGVQGATGGTGPQGAGVAGAQGTQGPQGVQGAASTVPGPQGPQGVQGGAAGGGTPGGATKQVQFNDAGVFAGDTGLTYDKTTKNLALGVGAMRTWDDVGRIIDVDVCHIRGASSIAELGANTYYSGGGWKYKSNGCAVLIGGVIYGGNPSFNVSMAPSGTAGAAASFVSMLNVDGSGNTSIGGKLGVADGSLATPAYTFAAENTTGLYRRGVSNIGYTLGGALAFSMHTSHFLATPPVSVIGWGDATISAVDIGIWKLNTNTLSVGKSGSTDYRDLVGRNLQATGQFNCTGSYIAAPAGSVAAPGYVFQGDAGTGFYSLTPGYVSITNSGVQGMRFTGPNILMPPGKIFGWAGDAAISTYGTVIVQENPGASLAITNAQGTYNDLHLRDLVAVGNIVASGNPNWTIAQASGNYGVVAYSTSGGAAFMTFHRSGNFAAHFGIDTDNVWKVGGWSMGATSYPVLHGGNSFSFYGGGHLNADWRSIQTTGQMLAKGYMPRTPWYSGQSGALTVDFNNGQCQRIDMTGNASISIINVPFGGIIRLFIYTGGFALTWSGSPALYFPNGSTPDPLAGPYKWCVVVAGAFDSSGNCFANMAAY